MFFVAAWKCAINSLAQTGDGGISQTLTSGFTPGLSYTLTAWGVAPEGIVNRAYIGLQFIDAADQKTSYTADITATAGFEQYALTLVIPEGTVSVSAYVYHEGGNTDVIIDDFSLMQDLPEVEPVLLGTRMNFKPGYVIVGQQIPARTGSRIYDNLVVGLRKEYE